MESVFDCANYLINKNYCLNYPAITPLKIQKLLYYAQVYSLVRYKRRLFNNHFEAWVHGPVCPEVYARYQNIKKNESIIESKKDDYNYGLSQYALAILNKILNFYGRFSGEIQRFQQCRITGENAPLPIQFPVC